MKKVLFSLAALFASASFSQAAWWPGKLLGRPNPNCGTSGTSWSACVSGPPAQFTFAITPSNGATIVNPVRSAVGRFVGMPATCLSGQCR